MGKKSLTHQAAWLFTALVLCLTGALITAEKVWAVPITVVDDAGPDDEPGQKDLNQLTVDFEPLDGHDMDVTWNWDKLSLDTGGNTFDACSLFDTDGDGNANYSLCVSIQEDTDVPADGTANYLDTKLYSCGDDKADRCTQPVTTLAQDLNGDGDFNDTGETLVPNPNPLTNTYDSFCDVPLDDQADDVFGSRSPGSGDVAADTQNDIQVTCHIDLNDFVGEPFLTNVCSYPSGRPNSDPSDCVIGPDSGFLTIVKEADPDDPMVDFVFNLGAGQDANDGRASFTILGSGSVSLISFTAGTDYDLSEEVPDDWQLDSLSCKLSDGTPTGTVVGNTVENFEIQIGRETTCTFTNSLAKANLTLIKEVNNDNGGTATADQWTLTADGADLNDLSGTTGVTGEVDAPDTFTLSEDGPDGYELTSLVCEEASNSGVAINVGDQLDLNPGDDVTCTFVNDDDAPSLTLVKEVINDNGGTAVPGDWTLTAAGYDAANPQTGTYNLSESGGPDGYTQTSLTCDNAAGQVTSATLGLGEDVTCTFVNDDDAPSLTLVKEVINDNGGTAVPGDWTLTAAGYDAANPQTGTYNLSESGGPDGYTQTSLTCDNAAGQVTSATLGLGEDVTCTFVNDDDAPSLTLVKEVINDNGGTAVPGDWTLTATGYDAANPQTGTYDLSESGPAGYTQTSLTCDNAAGQVTSATVGLGEDVTCTFVNDDDALSLTLVKEVINDNGGTAVPGDWTLTAAGYDAANPQTGTYDLSESGPAGYTQTSLTCDNAVGQVTSATVGLGEDVTCTFVNDDDAPSLTLVKEVINDNGGTAVPGDWTLTAAGYDAANPQTGTYDLSESGPDGYTQTSLTCDNAAGQVTSVTLGLGEDVTCTFVNDDDAPSLTLVKEVINDNGGTAVPGDWTLTATGYDAANPQTGTYDLSESGPAGYTQTSLTCDNAVGQVTSATVGLGEDVTCTFVNDDDAPSLTLVKEVINDNGGEAVPGDWTLTAAGYDAANPQTGTYDLSESGPAGYTQTSLTCSNSGDAQVTSVTVGLGEDVTCTFVNDDNAPSLTLVKEVINDNGGEAVPGDWTLTAAGYDAANPQTGTYDLSESGPAGYTQTSLTCDNAVGQVTSATVGLGEDVTCTFVNDDDAPSLTLVKEVINDNGGEAVPGDWTLTAAGYDAANPQTGTYDLSESGPAGYTQTSLTCSNSGDAQVTSVTVGLGEDVTCTFVNDDNAPSLTLVKEVINDNGGEAVPGDWALTAAGYDAANPQTGTYDLSESGPAGYTQTSLTCDNAVGQVTSVTLGLGEDVTCTFVNDDDAPSLTLVKEVINDNGGTAVPGDWTLTAAGYDAANPQTGTYDLSESGPAGYTQTSLTCDNAAGQVTSVTLGLGESVTCTFVNDDDAPSLTLVKEVINDNGGEAVPGDWTLTAAGYDAANPQTGTYDLSESGPAGYTQTSLTCDNAAGQVTSVTLGLGESVTCTFVNDDDAPSLTLVKEVINDNGGEAVPGDWTLTAAGYDAANPQTGTYDLSESGPAGYTQTSLTCDNAVGQVTSATVGLGEDVTCTFVNDDNAPSLTLVKVVENLGESGPDYAEIDDFILMATGLTSISGTSGVSSGAGFSAGSYDLSEAIDRTDYTASDWVCVGTGTQVDGDTVSLSVGQSATCTITNTLIPMPSLMVTKDANPTVISAPTTINYTVTVQNTGNVTLLPTLADLLSSGLATDLVLGLTLIDDGDGIGNLSPGETWVYSTSYDVSQEEIDNGSPIVNVVCEDDVDGNGEDECDDGMTEIDRNPAHTFVKDFDPDEVQVGGEGAFTLVYTNTGNVTLTDVEITDNIRPILEVNDVSIDVADGNCDNVDGDNDAQTLMCTIDDVGPGEMVIVTVTYTAIAEADVLVDGSGNTSGATYVFYFENGWTLYGNTETGEASLRDPDGNVTDVSGFITGKNQDVVFDPPPNVPIEGQDDPAFELHLSCSELFVDGWGSSGPVEGVDVNWRIDAYDVNRYNSGGFLKSCGQAFTPFDVNNTAFAEATAPDGTTLEPNPIEASDTVTIIDEATIQVNRVQVRRNGDIRLQLHNFGAEDVLIDDILFDCNPLGGCDLSGITFPEPLGAGSKMWITVSNVDAFAMTVILSSGSIFEYIYPQ